MSYVGQSLTLSGASVHSGTQERLRRRNGNQERLGISAASPHRRTCANDWVDGWMDGWIRLKRPL